MQYQFRPISEWPGERTKMRRRSQFSAAWSKTLDLLERELGYLRAQNIVIQAAVTLDDIRNDGMLRSNARPQWPGVILAFDSKHGPLSYPCDRFDDWQANVRAIALSLEALRSVDRYGVTRRAEQYKGWERLPAPSANGKFHSPQQAAEWLSITGGGNASDIVRGGELRERSYRNAAMATHPDAGGSADDFKKVQEAKDYLDKTLS